MSFELAPGTLLNNRYQIKKVVSFGSDGGVYVARDIKVTDKNWIVKEMIPSRELDETTLARRRARFTEAVESAMQFGHPNLPRILEMFTEARREYVVMEYVEGVSLQVLCDMSVNPLPEGQILTWSLQICDALAYLHDRPRPFIFGALEPSHVILTPDEKVKLINFGLDRFFGPDEPPNVFADNPADVKKEFVHLGQTLCYLLTKQKPTPLGLPSEPKLSPYTARVVSLMLEGEDQKTYESIKDVRKDLEVALNPPPEVKAEGGAPQQRAAKTVIIPKEEGETSTIGARVNRLVTAFASQRVSFVAAEVALLVVVLGALYWWTHPGIAYRKAGPTAYLAVGAHDLVTLAIGDQKVVDKQRLTATIGDIAVSDSWLLVSDSNSNRILRYDTNTDLPPEKNPAIMVDNNPTRMVIDGSGRYLFVAHESTHNVSRINLKRDPPQMDAILAVSNVPQELAVSPKGDVLYVANARDRNVAFLEPDTSKDMGALTVPGTPWGMAVSPEGAGLNQLWVCLQEPDGIAVVDLQTREVKQTITELMNGKRPTSAVFSADGSKVYVAMSGSGGVVVFDTAKMAPVKSIATAPSPKRLVYTPSRTQLWAICTGPSTSVTMIDPATDSVVGQVPLGDASGPAAMAK